MIGGTVANMDEYGLPLITGSDGNAGIASHHGAEEGWHVRIARRRDAGVGFSRR